MHYHINRNGQTYGPYTLDDLRRYLGTGNVLASDLVKSDEMPDWAPVSQLLAAEQAPAPTATVAVEQPVSAVYTQPIFADAVLQPVAVDPALANSPYPDAPNLHWGLVTLFTVLTCGLFATIWDIVIAVWLRRVQPDDRSLFWYLGALGIRALNYVLSLFLVGSFFSHHQNPTDLVLSPHFVGVASLSKMLTLIMVGLVITGNFVKRASLEEHFNGPEPVGLQLSGAMTFFFAPIYFQYHLNRINALKQAARYGAPRAF